MPGMIALILSYLSIFNLVQAGVLPQGNEAFIKIKRQDEAVGSSDVPTTNLDINDRNIFKSVAPDVLDRLALIVQYAAASYCNYNNEHPSGAGKINCHGLEWNILKRQANQQINVCPRVEALDTETLHEFRDVGFTDSTGFVAADHDSKLIILSYRGTHDINNFIANTVFALGPAPELCLLCLVHAGFYASYLLTNVAVFEAIDQARKKFPTYRLIITGHSLGGALANIAAVALRNKEISLDLYTYGAPRVGDWNFASYSSNQGYGDNYRVSHKHDPVPGLPPWWLPGTTIVTYYHIWPQYYITSGNHVLVTVNDIVVSDAWVAGGKYDGNESTTPEEVGEILPPQGYDQVAPGKTVDELQKVKIAAHFWYFSSTTGCDAEAGQEACPNGETGEGCMPPVDVVENTNVE